MGERLRHGEVCVFGLITPFTYKLLFTVLLNAMYVPYDHVVTVNVTGYCILAISQ